MSERASSPALLSLGICLLFMVTPTELSPASSRVENSPRQADSTDVKDAPRNCFKSTFFPASWTKLLVATGQTDLSSSTVTADVEVIDLKELHHLCPKPADFPAAVSGAVGAFIAGQPVICGGTYEDGHDRCYAYSNQAQVDAGEDSWRLLPYAMAQSRQGAAAVALPGERLWVTGGIGVGTEILQTTEILEGGTFSFSNSLPSPTTAHALLSVDEDHFFLVGGIPSGPVTNAWLLEDGEWLPQAPTMYTHETIIAGLASRLDGMREIVITGSEPNVTEVLGITQDGGANPAWRLGPLFPGHIVRGTHVPIGNAFLAVGGFDRISGEATDQIHLFDPDNDLWIVYPQTLSLGRMDFVAMLVPDEYCPGGHDDTKGAS